MPRQVLGSVRRNYARERHGQCDSHCQSGPPPRAMICVDDPVVAERGEDFKEFHWGEEDSCSILACWWHGFYPTAQQCQWNSKEPKPFSHSQSQTLITCQHLGNEAPPAYGSPAPSYGSPAPEAVTPGIRSANATDSHSYNGSKSTTDSASNAVASAQSTVGAAASSVANAIPTSGDDLRAQLAQAKATIARMTQQSEEQGQRQRKTDAVNQDSRERMTTDTTGMGVQQQPTDGVPVQIVAALCLLSFLLAYFLFWSVMVWSVMAQISDRAVSSGISIYCAARAKCAEAQKRTCFILEFFTRSCPMTRLEKAKISQMGSQDMIEGAAAFSQGSRLAKLKDGLEEWWGVGRLCYSIHSVSCKSAMVLSLTTLDVFLCYNQRSLIWSWQWSWSFQAIIVGHYNAWNSSSLLLIKIPVALLSSRLPSCPLLSFSLGTTSQPLCPKWIAKSPMSNFCDEAN